MFRKFMLPAVLGLAVLGIAADSAQAQLRARLTESRQMRQERRDMRRGVVRTTDQPAAMAVPFTYDGPGYRTQSISYYYSPSQPLPTVATTGTFRVILPDANGRVFVDGVATQQTGMDRMFVTPILEPATYKYTIRAAYLVNGREVTHVRTIEVRPGQLTVLDLTDATRPETRPETRRLRTIGR